MKLKEALDRLLKLEQRLLQEVYMESQLPGGHSPKVHHMYADIDALRVVMLSAENATRIVMLSSEMQDIADTRT